MGWFLILLLSLFHLIQGQQTVEEEVIVPRRVPLLGGWSEANPERDDVQKAAEKAVEKFNTNSKAKYYFKLVNILSAHTQITNMINFNIEAVLGKTGCLKPEPTDLDSCALGKKQLICKCDVQFNPRKMKYTAKTVSCKK